MNSKRKCRRWICHGLIVVMMVSIMGPIFSMMAENQTYAYTRTMNVNDWLEQCRLIAIKISDEKARYSSRGCPTAYFDRDFSRKRYKGKTRLHCADYASWCLQ